METDTYNQQINTLVIVNNIHIQKQEQEIAKLMGKKRALQEELQGKEIKIQEITTEKTHFRNNYFKTLPSRVFSRIQVNFFQNQLARLEARIASLQQKKRDLEKKIQDLEKQLLESRTKLKKFSFKNEKYVYLKEALEFS